MNVLDWKRHLLALAFGFFGGLLPNKKSNIHPLLMGFILAILATKVVFGDYDTGYAWTRRDIIFVLIVGGEGALGGYLSKFAV